MKIIKYSPSVLITLFRLFHSFTGLEYGLLFPRDFFFPEMILSPISFFLCEISVRTIRLLDQFFNNDVEQGILGVIVT